MRLTSACLLAAVAMACSDPTSEDFAEERALWEASKAERVSPTAIRLRSGECLDMARLPAPWQLAANDQPRSFTVAASGEDVGVAPFEREGWDSSFEGLPHDGRVRVVLAGWAPEDGRFSSQFVPPERAEQNLMEGRSKRVPLWGESSEYEAHVGALTIYMDKRRLTQCRDYSDMILCHVVSADEQFGYSVRLARSNLKQLPAKLDTITGAMEQARGACGARAGVKS